MSDARTPQLSLVIPAYDESQRLGPSLRTVFAYLDDEFGDWEVVVVDDGSEDDTAAVAESAFDGDPRCSLIRLPRNRGKGAAVRAGALAARGERVLFSDADLSTPIEDERKLREAIDAGADVAIASRSHPQANVSRPQDALRESLGKLFNWLLRRLGLTKLHDTQCGFKMFRREAAQEVFGKARIDGFAFDVEILLLAERAGLDVAEVPVEWRNDPSSRLGLSSAPRILLELLRLVRMHRRHQL